MAVAGVEDSFAGSEQIVTKQSRFPIRGWMFRVVGVEGVGQILEDVGSVGDGCDGGPECCECCVFLLRR